MDGYHAAMVSSLAAKGYCGFFDGEEIQVKRTNELTEHYDVNYSDKYIRTGAGIYRRQLLPGGVLTPAGRARLEPRRAGTPRGTSPIPRRMWPLASRMSNCSV